MKQQKRSRRCGDRHQPFSMPHADERNGRKNTKKGDSKRDKRDRQTLVMPPAAAAAAATAIASTQTISLESLLCALASHLFALSCSQNFPAPSATQARRWACSWCF